MTEKNFEMEYRIDLRQDADLYRMSLHLWKVFWVGRFFVANVVSKAVMSPV